MRDMQTSQPILTRFKFSKPIPYIRNTGLGIGALFGFMFIMIGLLSVAVALITGKEGAMSTPVMRISTVLQDILVFILPAIAAAMLVTRLPATLLKIDVRPQLKQCLLACIILLTSMPLMNLIVEWNQNITLPESLQGIESALKGLEESASGAIGSMIGGTSVADLAISILLIGVLTGVAEELFFRGAFQNLLFSTRMRRHLAVWIAAIVFSLLHFQFYGFVPRILLGAYFGYLMWWTGSVWTPVICHALNNSLAVLGTWVSAKTVGFDEAVANADFSLSHDFFTVALSTAVTIIGMHILYRSCVNRRRPSLPQDR